MITLLESVVALGIFWLLVLFLSSRVDLTKYGILIAPLIIIYRTERIIPILSKLADKLEKKSLKLRNLSAITSLTLFFVFPFVLILNLIKSIYIAPSPIFQPNPIKFIDTSIFVFIIPFFLAMLFYHFTKSILLRIENVNIRKIGIILIIVFPTTFIQITKDQYSKLSRRGFLRIIGGSIMINLLFAMLLLLIQPTLGIILTPMYKDGNGALIVSVIQDSPAAEAGLNKGDVITGMQRIQFTKIVSSKSINSSNQFITELRNIPPGEKFNIILIDNILITLKGINPPVDSGIISGSFIGIEVHDYSIPRITFLSLLIPFYFELMISWLINYALIISLVNLLPLPIGEGKNILNEILNSIEPLSNTARRSIYQSIIVLSTALILLNLYITI